MTLPPIPVIIDTDPGIDDAMAILLAGKSPAIDLVGLTTIYGNVDVQRATRNALHLGDLLGQPIPVATGAARPLVQTPEPHADFVHGAEGFGDTPLPQPTRQAEPLDAVDFIIQESHKHDGKLVLCPIGPLTNIALALRKDPTLVERIAEVVIMGGAVRWRGNVNEFAEANIWNDPHAAAEVFAADWPVRLVGLDVTEQLSIWPHDFEPVKSGAPKLGAWIAQAHEFYFDFHLDWYMERKAYLHDPTAVLAITNPEYFEFHEALVEVVLGGEAKGQTREIDPDQAEKAANSAEILFAASVDITAATRHMLAACASFDD